MICFNWSKVSYWLSFSFNHCQLDYQLHFRYKCLFFAGAFFWEYIRRWQTSIIKSKAASSTGRVFIWWLCRSSRDSNKSRWVQTSPRQRTHGNSKSHVQSSRPTSMFSLFGPCSKKNHKASKENNILPAQ